MLGEEKRQALIGANTAELDAITRREEMRILEGTRLEERRAKATAALATHHKLADKKPTLLMLVILWNSCRKGKTYFNVTRLDFSEM